MREGVFEATAALTCDNCGFINLVLTKVTSGGWDAGAIVDWIDDERSEPIWLPRSAGMETFDDVPAHIASSASEATACASIGAHRAAILMARTVIEATAKANGIEKGNLVNKIDALKTQNLVRPDIAEAAHEIRLIGNDMAHGDNLDDVAAEEADEILELMAEVLAEVFQGPARLAARKARRELAKSE